MSTIDQSMLAVVVSADVFGLLGVGLRKHVGWTVRISSAGMII